ncbi:hypothetical protein [Methylocapsa acidiphila]|uniref:hypothetical protein n=1 Tax=Methylocapsa acidiphila TaxID=133552 RepID=UPI000425FAF8|nr:hypothetical protein [Methylocapsa acidiphila]
MASSAVDRIDLTDTKVPIGIPLAAIFVFGVVQLALGTDPLIMALCAISIAAPLLPLHLYGRDLYSMIGIMFSLRYVGVALIAKTFLGQTLESHLFDAYTAFGLTALLMCVITALLLIARALDASKVLFDFSMDLPSLRRLALVCFAIGAPAEIVAGVGMQGVGETSSGAIFPLAASIGDLLYLGLIAEAIHGIKKSEGRSFLGLPLAAMALFVLMMALAFNRREFFLSSLIGVIATAFIYRALRLRHIVLGLAFAAFFMSFMTPITLYLRTQREGMDKVQFMMLAKDTVVRAITEPGYFDLISETVENSSIADIKSDSLYDYYQNNSNVLNRLSFIALLDSIAYPAKSRNPIGMEDITHALGNNAPGFLGFEKTSSLYGMGDWLNWHMDIGHIGQISFLIFGLPMEGLVSWGIIGFVAYPFIFLLPIVLVSGRISSLRLPLPTSIFIFASLQHGLVEATSDGFISMITRGLPVLAVSLLMVQKAMGVGAGAKTKSASGNAFTTHQT